MNMLKPNGKKMFESVYEGKYDNMLEDKVFKSYFVVKNLDIADELADKIEGKHLGDTDIYNG